MGVREVSGAIKTIVIDPEASRDRPEATEPLILLSAVAQTNRGRRRKNNEDSFAVVEAHHMFVVADGMGGYAGGEIASRTAVDTMAATYADAPTDLLPDPAHAAGARLAATIKAANLAIWTHAQGHPELQGMGTTVVAAVFAPFQQRVYIGHVGDSRCYRYRGDALQRLTTDHTLAEAGIEGPRAHMLTRAVGIGPDVPIDLILVEPEVGDAFLLCSDGLTKMVAEPVIHELLRTAESAAVAVEALINHANANGGRDNITVIVIQVRDGAAAAVEPATA